MPAEAVVDIGQVTEDLKGLYTEGYRSVAIVFAHSYLYNGHEKQVEKIARSVGFKYISVSSDLQAMINLNSRGSSATADAYLTPEIRRYLDGFAEGFVGKLETDACRVSFMQSDGALCHFKRFSGLKAILCKSRLETSPPGGLTSPSWSRWRCGRFRPHLVRPQGWVTCCRFRYGRDIHGRFEVQRDL